MTADRVVLWRHGRTASNLEGRWQGQLDVPLDDVGTAQARAAARALVALEPAALVSSDLSRALSTAGALAHETGLDVEADPALREVHGGAWQGLLTAEIESRSPQEYAAWRGGEDAPAGGGERRSEAGSRVAGAVEQHAGRLPGGTLVVVGHGAALGAALVQLLGLGAGHRTVLTGLHNARWSTLVAAGAVAAGARRWRLGEHNATAR